MSLVETYTLPLSIGPLDMTTLILRRPWIVDPCPVIV